MINLTFPQNTSNFCSIVDSSMNIFWPSSKHIAYEIPQQKNAKPVTQNTTHLSSSVVERIYLLLYIPKLFGQKLIIPKTIEKTIPNQIPSNANPKDHSTLPTEKFEPPICIAVSAIGPSNGGWMNLIFRGFSFLGPQNASFLKGFWDS